MSDKPLLFFIHGMFCTKIVLKEVIVFCEELGYECKAITLPNHDISPPYQPSPYLATTSLIGYVEYIAEEIHKLDQPYILIGHSMGGLLAAKTAARDDIDPQGLVMLAPASPWGIDALKPSVVKSFKNIITTRGFWKKPIKMSYAEVEYAMLNKVPQVQRRAIYDTMVWESGRAAFEIGFWMCDLFNRASSFDQSKINCPVVVFTGTADHITPVTVVRNTVKKIDKKPVMFSRKKLPKKRTVKLIELPNQGHWLMVEMDLNLLVQELDIICQTT